MLISRGAARAGEMFHRWCSAVIMDSMVRVQSKKETGKQEGEGTRRNSRPTEEGGGGPDVVGNAVR